MTRVCTLCPSLIQNHRENPTPPSLRAALGLSTGHGDATNSAEEGRSQRHHLTGWARPTSGCTRNTTAGGGVPQRTAHQSRAPAQYGAVVSDPDFAMLGSQSETTATYI